jgi:ParB/RepB/Spo0J family partition protein
MSTFTKLRREKAKKISLTKEDIEAMEEGPLATLEDDEDENGEPLKQPEKFDALKAKGKSRPKDRDPNAKPTSAASLLAGIEVVEERDIEYAKIKRSTQNPRQIFDEALIDEMSTNIVTICQLNPLTIREGTNELIDGETRHRAGEVGKAKSLRCKIVRCTDAQAACLRLMTSIQRRDLNPIEKAEALQALLDQHGISQRELADVVKMQQGSIDNIVRLLKLPRSWKDKVISGEITAAAARELVPWVTEQDVLDDVAEKLAGIAADERSTSLSRQLTYAISENSHQLTIREWIGNRSVEIKLKPTDAQRELLRIRKVKIWSHVEERCFNTQLWKELADTERKRVQERAAKKSDNDAKVIDPKKAAENAERQKEMFAKKIYRYRTAWYQRRIVAFLQEADHATLMKYALFFAARGEGSNERSVMLTARGRPGYHGFDAKREDKDLDRLISLKADDLWNFARQAIKDFCCGKFDNYHPSLTPPMIEQLAIDARVNLAADWPRACKEWCEAKGKSAESNPDPIDGYLQLLNKDQLLELGAEWKLSLKDLVDATSKRSEVIAAIAKAGRGRPVPKALSEAKSVSLT